MNLPSLYDSPAEYDAIFGPTSLALARYVVRLAAKYRPSGRVLLEPACGTGLVLLPLATRFECHGFDISREAIARAQAALKPASFWVDDLTTFSFPRRADVAFCLTCTLNELDTPGLLAHLRRAWLAIQPGGIYAFDVHHGAMTGPHRKGKANGVTWSAEFMRPESTCGETVDRLEFTINGQKFAPIRVHRRGLGTIREAARSTGFDVAGVLRCHSLAPRKEATAQVSTVVLRRCQGEISS